MKTGIKNQIVIVSAVAAVLLIVMLREAPIPKRQSNPSKTFSKRVGMIKTTRTSFLMVSKSHFVTTVSSTKLKPSSMNLR